jgi:hypothetical protein
VASVTDIWNQAAGRIGQLENITDEQAEGSTAKWCRHYYALARDVTLQSYDWAFARRAFWAPTLAAYAPHPPWSYCLQLPPGALRVHSYHQGDLSSGATVDRMAETAFVVSEPTGTEGLIREVYWSSWMDTAPAEPFQVSGETSMLGADTRYILTMTEGGFVRFTRKVTDAAQFDPLFTDAVAWKLAGDLAMSKAGSRELRNDCLQMYQRCLEAAAIASSRQEKVRTIPSAGDLLAAYR